MKKLLPVLLLAFLPAPALAGGMSPQLMLSSAWCSFTYNKVTGYSSRKRFQFNPNGSYGVGARGEGSSSGAGGSFASQRDSGGAGLWRVVQGELYMSEGRGQLQLVRTQLKRTNTGMAVIVADGVEYTPCR